MDGETLLELLLERMAGAGPSDGAELLVLAADQE